MMRSPKAPIGDHVEKVKTWNPKTRLSGTFKYIDLSSVDKDLKQIASDQVSELATQDAPSRARQLVRAGDILVATVRPNLNGVALVGDKFDGATASTGYCVLRPNVESLYSGYLFHWVKTRTFVDEMVKHATGANYPAISDRVIKSSLVPLPPLKEQKRIAAILDKADAILRKREQAIQLADQFLRAVFLDMFGDPVKNSKGWEVREISEICSEIVDCVNRTAPTVDRDTPYKMIRTTNVRNNRLGLVGLKCVEKDVYEKWVRRLKPSQGDIIFTREAPAGEAAIIDTDEKIFLGQRMMHYRPNNNLITSEFLLFEMMSSRVQRQIDKMHAGSTVTHLSVPECKKFQLRVPPLHQQQIFSKIYSCTLSALDNQSTYRKNSQYLFDSISQKAFAGEL